MRLGRDTTLRLGELARLVIGRYLVDAGGAASRGPARHVSSRSLGQFQ
jgi:hypothetical protein